MSTNKTFKNAAEAATALEALIKEARGVLKDIRSELKKVKEEAVSEIRSYVQTQVEIQVAEQLAKLGKKTKEAMDKSVERVLNRFEMLENLIRTGDEYGNLLPDKADLNQLVLDYVRKNGALKQPRDPSIIRKPK